MMSLNYSSIKASTKLSEHVSKKVKLKKVGSEHVGLCPFHSERTPSFKVHDEKMFYHCFGCGAHGDIFDWYEQAEGSNISIDFDALALDRSAVADKKVLSKKSDYAKQLWMQTSTLKGSVAENYLNGRGIGGMYPPTLRYHPCLKHGPTEQSYPGLVAGVWNQYRDIIGLQRIFLSADGSQKAAVDNAKMSLGNIRGGAVRLSKLNNNHKIFLTEGIEDGLSILKIYPEKCVWAVLGSHNFTSVQTPLQIDEIVIGADNDSTGVSEAKKAAKFFCNNGFKTSIAYPPKQFKDFNEALIKGNQIHEYY